MLLGWRRTTTPALARLVRHPNFQALAEKEFRGFAPLSFAARATSPALSSGVPTPLAPMGLPSAFLPVPASHSFQACGPLQKFCKRWGTQIFSQNTVPLIAEGDNSAPPRLCAINLRVDSERDTLNTNIIISLLFRCGRLLHHQDCTAESFLGGSGGGRSSYDDHQPREGRGRDDLDGEDGGDCGDDGGAGGSEGDGRDPEAPRGAGAYHDL